MPCLTLSVLAETKEECEEDNPMAEDDSEPTDALSPISAPVSGPPHSTSGVNTAMAPAAMGPIPTESGAGGTETELGGIGLPGDLESIAEVAEQPSPAGPGSSNTQGSTVTEQLVLAQADDPASSSAHGTREALCQVTSSVLAAVIVSAAFSALSI